MILNNYINNNKPGFFRDFIGNYEEFFRVLIIFILKKLVSNVSVNPFLTNFPFCFLFPENIGLNWVKTTF